MNNQDAARTAYHEALAAYRAAKEQNQRSDLKRAELQERIDSLDSELCALQDALSKTLASYGGGTATEDDVTRARQHVTTAKTKAQEAREMLNAIAAQGPAQAGELHRLRTQAAQAREHLAAVLWGPIEQRLKADRKLRRALVQIHALTEAARSAELATASSMASWDGLLLDVFPEPDAEEFMPVFEEVSAHFNIEPSEVA